MEVKEKNPEKKEKDKCVVCEKETQYDADMPVDNRLTYVEGVGQVCISCFRRSYNL